LRADFWRKKRFVKLRGLVRRPLIFFILSLFLLFPSFFLYAQEDNQPCYGDAIIVGSIGEPITLVPILAADSASQDIVGLVFNGLLKYDKDINLVGDLAEDWEVSEDGLVITFYLRKGVKWQDGVPFTAEDVLFTYKKLVDPHTKTPYSGDFERIKKFEVIDDYTIKITYKQPFSPALASWTMPIMPSHLLKNEEDFKHFARHPVGTGPYRFIKWETGSKIVLEAYDEYFQGRPYIDRYIYYIIPDQSTLFLELKNRNLDYISLTPLQYQRQTNTEFFKKNFRKYRYLSFGYTYIGWNLNNPKFKDKRVRQAINYAIDKEEIIKGVLLGLGRVCTGPFVPNSWAYNPAVKPAEYNPEKARQLLALAGWKKKDKEGILLKGNERFEFTLLTNQGNVSRRKCAEIIQQKLREIGIKMHIKIVEWGCLLDLIERREFEAVLLGWGLSRDPDCYDIFHSSKTGPREFNFVSYKNKEVDRLLEEGRRVFSQSKRKEIYQKVHKLIYEDQPYTFLYVPDALPIIDARFRGIEPTINGIGYNFIKWWVPKDKQRFKR